MLPVPMDCSLEELSRDCQIMLMACMPPLVFPIVEQLSPEGLHWLVVCVKSSMICKCSAKWLTRGVYIREAVRSLASHKHESDFNECTRVI